MAGRFSAQNLKCHDWNLWFKCISTSDMWASLKLDIDKGFCFSSCSKKPNKLKCLVSLLSLLKIERSRIHGRAPCAQHLQRHGWILWLEMISGGVHAVFFSQNRHMWVPLFLWPKTEIGQQNGVRLPSHDNIKSVLLLLCSKPSVDKSMFYLLSKSTYMRTSVSLAAQNTSKRPNVWFLCSLCSKLAMSGL